MNPSKNWIRDARLAAGLTQGQLAEELDINNSAVSRIETGLSTPSITTLYRISVLLGNESMTEALAPFVAADGGPLYKNRKVHNAA